jgi:hypothetical protein
MTKAQKEKTIQPWDRRPWPKSGDEDDDTLYRHVGRFLSLWEKYEASLAFLFSSFFGPLPVSAPARRAFFSVRTFEGRAEMLRAASSSHFESRPSYVLTERFKDILRDALSFSPRRNDIAHGLVDSFGSVEDWERYGHSDNHGTFSLYPSVASFRERSNDGKPSYCMTSVEIDYFYAEVAQRQPAPLHLGDDIIRQRRSTSLRKSRPPSTE